MIDKRCPEYWLKPQGTEEYWVFRFIHIPYAIDTMSRPLEGIEYETFELERPKGPVFANVVEAKLANAGRLCETRPILADPPRARDQGTELIWI